MSFAYHLGQPYNAYEFRSPSQPPSQKPSLSPRATRQSDPYLRIVSASYGYGTQLQDVTSAVQQMVWNSGGLRFIEFGYPGLTRNGCMNTAFGDPCPGKDKELYISYEVVGTRKLKTVSEDKRINLDLPAMFNKANRGGDIPSETKTFCLDIIKATYGLGNEVYDVTSTLRIMVAQQGGKTLNAFGYVISPNGAMNKAFGDPCPGSDKILTVEYIWKTPITTISVEEDRQVKLDFTKLKQLGFL